jgi:hypothetical protein
MGILNKLNKLIDDVNSLKEHQLRDVSSLADIVRKFGMLGAGRPWLYENYDATFIHQPEPLFWQKPNEFARALVYLSNFEINSYCEIGIARCGTFVMTTAYLMRVNKNFRKSLGVDNGLLECFKNWRPERLPITIHQGTSFDLSKQKYDLALIDGSHNYNWVKNDWFNIGQHSNICMFHDIVDDDCPGVKNFWNKYHVNRDYVQFVAKPTNSMGIGIIHN